MARFLSAAGSASANCTTIDICPVLAAIGRAATGRWKSGDWTVRMRAGDWEDGVSAVAGRVRLIANKLLQATTPEIKRPVATGIPFTERPIRHD
jgi:hypothetical protein